MGGRRLHYFLYLCLMFLIIYFSAYYVNFEQSHPIPQHLNKTKKASVIPSVIVYYKDRHHKEFQKECENKFDPSNISVSWNNNWQRLNSNSSFYIYSAHTDSRLGPSDAFIRIIAMSKGKHDLKLYCRFWYETDNSSVEHAAAQEIWVKAWDDAKPDQYYRPLLLSCPVTATTLPTAVSLVSEPCQKPQNRIQLATSPKDRTMMNFAVCLKPLDFDEDISLRLLEWLELQFILGANTVSVYIYRAHPQVWKLLNSYEYLEKVTIKNHTLPGDDGPNSASSRRQSVWQKRRHEMIVYNDCFYRHIGTHKYIVNLDLDEALIPLIHDTWSSLLKQAFKRNPKLLKSSSLSAANVYFFDSFGQYPDDSIPSYMHMLKHVYRSANFTPPGFAQKSFFSSNLSLAVSNHYTLSVLRPQTYTNCAIGRDLVHLHHYRSTCPPLMDEDCKKNYIKFRRKDTIIWRFKDKLIRNVVSKIKDLNLK